MSNEANTEARSRYRVTSKFGSHWVEYLDNNGVWVVADPSAPDCKTREEAEEMMERHVDLA